VQQVGSEWSAAGSLGRLGDLSGADGTGESSDQAHPDLWATGGDQLDGYVLAVSGSADLGAEF
jgi:hypothetical protein